MLWKKCSAPAVIFNSNNHKSCFVKRIASLLFLLFFSQFVFAQSAGDDGAVLTAPRTYRKMSGDSIRLRASVALKMEKQADKVFAKIVDANLRARKKAARELARKYRLGDRVIVRGDSGRDVRSVANALVKKLYIKPEDVIPTFDNGALYDGALYEALVEFQKRKGLPADGRVTERVVKELRKRK
jgi:hypothetical protein